MAMKVSLCEPHSWLASMLGGEPGNGGRLPTSPLLEAHGVGTSWPVTARYFSYQDAPSYDFKFPAPTELATATQSTATARAESASRRMLPPLRLNLRTPKRSNR